MKNVKYLLLVGLGCAALLLTGCGGNAHSLTCKKTNASESLTVEFEYNDNEDELVGIKYNGSVKIPDFISEEEKGEFLKNLEGLCDDKNLKSCDVSRKGDKVVVEFSVGSSSLSADEFAEINSLTKEELKQRFEYLGHTCK